MYETLRILRIKKPETIFTIGGGCDADIPTVAYLNEQLEGNLTVLWFDAHADLNTPAESSTALFYGMPVRFLLGCGDDDFSEIVKVPLTPKQIINIGGRDLDIPEKQFIADSGLCSISAHSVITDYTTVLEAIQSSHHNNIYIHMDLDVFDPIAFSNTPLPVPDGLSIDIILKILMLLKSKTNIVGFGLYEYKPCGEKNTVVEQLIRYALSL